MGYIIKHQDEMRKYVPVNGSFDIENSESGFKMAEREIKDIISAKVYLLALAFYESDKYANPESDQEKLMKKLVEYIQAPFSNYAIYDGFIWKILNVNNSSITIITGDNEKSPNKGQLIEAKEDLLEKTWAFVADLIDFLNENEDAIVDSDNKVWKESEQYKKIAADVFDGYRDFDEFLGIDKSAVFFMKTNAIRQRIVDDELDVRLGDISEVLNAENKDEKLIRKIKRFMVFRTTAIACEELAITNLPATIRQTYDREIYAAGGKEDSMIKTKIAKHYHIKADDILKGIDLYQNSKKKLTTNETFTTDFENTPDADDKFFNAV
ncbi:MAG: hypothetical protein N4A59_16385 [Marinifilum sp.]|jgi:hypothetical protein|nr:hypothetical protein [Marinifilum sp.]